MLHARKVMHILRMLRLLYACAAPFSLCMAHGQRQGLEVTD